jgi:hypothetical protein
MFKRIAGVALIYGALVVASPAHAAVEWREAKTMSGTIVNTSTVGSSVGGLPQNGQLPPRSTRVVIRPVKESFSVATKYFRLKWETEATAERQSLLRVSLYKLDKRGNKDRWRKAGTVGRMRGGQMGEKVFTIGEGEYYMELTGSNIKYTFTLEEAFKAPKSSSKKEK